MDRPRPACPICGATDERPPDALGVHRCPACAIEFRPPGRMPIRLATVSPGVQPNHDFRTLIYAMAIVGASLGIAVAVGDHKAGAPPPTLPPPIVFQPQPPPLDPAVFELGQLDELALTAPLAPLALEHEVHVSQIIDRRLFATGLIHAPSSLPVDEVTLEVSGRDLVGASQPSQQAVVSCEMMQPGESCAWMIDVELPSSVVEFEFEASGRYALGLGLPQLDLRSDRSGELELDAERGFVTFRTSAPAVLEAWATVTAYSPEQRVLGVTKTLWPDRLPAGRHRLQVTVPESDVEIGRYQVRVGGMLPNW
ncbi:MAG TPA: hypothetical protein VK034_25645 [Enhygromyxa sp.]|nr:hypothetical protein [Enhygromyxa sp.]